MIEFVKDYTGTKIGEMRKAHSPVMMTFGYDSGGCIDVIRHYSDSGRVLEAFWILDNQLKEFVESRTRDGYIGMFRTRMKDTNTGKADHLTS